MRPLHFGAAVRVEGAELDLVLRRIELVGGRQPRDDAAGGVDLHAGGGGYAGYSQSAGMTVVATGTADAAGRLAASLNVDTAIGVLRHADAGYGEALATAREHGLGLEQ